MEAESSRSLLRRSGASFTPPAALIATATNGDHALPAQGAGPGLVDCEECGNRFRALLTDGRCTACNHRHGGTNRAGGASARLVDLASTPLGFKLMLIILGSVQLLLFVVAVSRS